MCDESFRVHGLISLSSQGLKFLSRLVLAKAEGGGHRKRA